MDMPPRFLPTSRSMVRDYPDWTAGHVPAPALTTGHVPKHATDLESDSVAGSPKEPSTESNTSPRQSLSHF